jgi:hypothetical protein
MVNQQSECVELSFVCCDMMESGSMSFEKEAPSQDGSRIQILTSEVAMVGADLQVGA